MIGWNKSLSIQDGMRLVLSEAGIEEGHTYIGAVGLAYPQWDPLENECFETSLTLLWVTVDYDKDHTCRFFVAPQRVHFLVDLQ